MKKCICCALCFVLCFLMLTGCSCNHKWIEADCLTPKTCSLCQLTEGTLLGHESCDGEEHIDVIAATTSRTQYCSRCNKQMSVSDPMPLDSMISDGMFLFTPNQFMKRLKTLAAPYITDFVYDFTSEGPLISHITANGKQALVQFFRQDTTPLSAGEEDVAEVWCVNLTAVNESDNDLRFCFFIACDPTLNHESAFTLDMQISVAYLNATLNGEPAGYYQQNDLLYENIYIADGTFAQPDAMNLVNIYASDFR